MMIDTTTWKDFREKVESLNIKDDTKIYFTDYSFGGIGDEFNINSIEITDNNILLITNPGGCDCGLE